MLRSLLQVCRKALRVVKGHDLHVWNHTLCLFLKSKLRSAVGIIQSLILNNFFQINCGATSITSPDVGTFV